MDNVLVFSNNLSLSIELCKNIEKSTDYNVYVAEERAKELLFNSSFVNALIIELFGDDAYVNGELNPLIFDDENNDEKCDQLQDFIQKLIMDEVKELDKSIIVSNEIVQLDFLPITPNLICIEFFKDTLYENDICLESMKTISSHIIEPKDLDYMEMELRGCIIDILGH